MKRSAGPILAVLSVTVTAGFLAATSGAVIQAPTGDTCSASGSGTAYTLNITLPSDAAQQGGFAIGSAGVTVTSIKSTTQGAFSTQSLPPNTSGELLLTNAAVVGASVTASLTTSGPVTGSFTVVTTTVPSSAFFTPFVCEVSSTGAEASNAFATQQHTTYDATTGTWHELVTVPGAGILSSVQEMAAAGVVASKPLIEGDRVSVKSAGRVALTLRPTGSGKKALKATGMIKLKLNITFSPTNGMSANKTVNLTLKK